VTLFEDACSYDLVRKKRLSRQRERCLRHELVVMDADWVQCLHEIATSYLANDEANEFVEPESPRRLRQDEPYVGMRTV
ncbi:MAG TPA: hypothetical protein PK156_22275, partial [Polyangium sp.]|nr:hypothetical protein [Polyangium sp.]